MKRNTGNNCDGLGDSVRALAESAGIQLGDLQAEAYRLHDKLGPDRQKAYNECIRQMARGGAVSDTEQRMLLELGKRGIAGGAFGGLRMSGWNPIGGLAASWVALSRRLNHSAKWGTPSLETRK